MENIDFAIQSKSDQLNAVDIMSENRVIKIRDVDVAQREQPVWIYFDGDNNRPWKPSKGMLRVLATAWGKNSKDWIGKHVELYFDETVKWAGKAVGGIRIKSISDISEDGISVYEVRNRSQRALIHIDQLVVQAVAYPEDEFVKRFPKMVEAMNTGKMSLQEVIARCQKTAQLNEDQMLRLENAAPMEIEENEDD